MKALLASRWLRLALALVTLVAIAAALLPFVLRPLVAARIRARAAAAGYDASWSRLELSWPPRLSLSNLTLLRRDTRDTTLTARSIRLALAPGSLLQFAPRLDHVTASDARVRLPKRSHAEGGDDAELEFDVSPGPDRRALPPEAAARGRRLRNSAAALARALTQPFDRLPAFSFTNVEIRPASGDEALIEGVRIGLLERTREAKGDRLLVAGSVLGRIERPFELTLTHTGDGHYRGTGRIALPDERESDASLLVSVDGTLTHDPRTAVLTLADSSRVRVGEIPLRLGVRLDPRGPRIRLSLHAERLTQALVERSLPRAALGPLQDLGTVGSWDYLLEFALDAAQPESVRFEADVVPHGLALDPERTFVHVLGLDEPFVARIRLPHDRSTTRLLVPGAGSFVPLTELSPDLVHAVVTNEDGAFFRHRGFNPRAVRESIAENLRAGSFRRGAGTITMQIARNLFTGHDRTLGRKFQEVVFAWVLENLSGVSKERLLEIYLNIIEWGPDIHGAEEASHYYFGKSSRDLSLDEALFLAVVIPSPSKWRNRFDAEGRLRKGPRSQMAFIARKMSTLGWLDPARIPHPDSLRVTLTGPAADSGSVAVRPARVLPGPFGFGR
ncbi:MAG: transglycosylase domain-containing protein [Candidatus Eisenbacteria bacterium]|uniref:Transglycosylase domain-containing protein n=1 Tax=Eiseniibacteriota bacterium TaxID=2212470 RepID=A0A849SN62_UNCEI|nr:transglycosylase domain-containing protein [Candidatus Eisenbacteria bacterium]